MNYETVRLIQEEVARAFGISLRELVGHSTTRRCARPRQIAMLLCTELTPRSLGEIAAAFGNRDHTTVIHAVRQAVNMLGRDRDLAAAAAIARRAIEAQIAPGDAAERLVRATVAALEAALLAAARADPLALIAQLRAAAGVVVPVPARDVAPGARWSFGTHRSAAALPINGGGE